MRPGRGVHFEDKRLPGANGSGREGDHHYAQEIQRQADQLEDEDRCQAGGGARQGRRGQPAKTRPQDTAPFSVSFFARPAWLVDRGPGQQALFGYVGACHLTITITFPGLVSIDVLAPRASQRYRLDHVASAPATVNAGAIWCQDRCSSTGARGATHWTARPTTMLEQALPGSSRGTVLEPIPDEQEHRRHVGRSVRAVDVARSIDAVAPPSRDTRAPPGLRQPMGRSELSIDGQSRAAAR
ncbi:uncharacterized protein PSFLO_03535 [Pseudozyma flocculosa]|uniref:Uncharacterized protein n=1 Tax=Pseudozyma flocculosa TaxID=84751 RepID=A0A5C3F0V6_9BASI|nr:uncharacterized protein PSFLO_03535 [Pseudozyma flocculosa]